MAAAPVAYKFSIAVATGYIPRYNKIHWQQSCPVKEAAGGCPSAPCSASMQAPPQPADADGTALAPVKARRKARTCQVTPKHASKQVEDLELAWIYIYIIYIYIIFVWKLVLTSLQTSLQQHSRKRLFIPAFQIVAVSSQSPANAANGAPPVDGQHRVSLHCRLAAASKRIQ